jgi:hypothetical protein
LVKNLLDFCYKILHEWWFESRVTRFGIFSPFVRLAISVFFKIPPLEYEIILIKYGLATLGTIFLLNHLVALFLTRMWQAPDWMPRGQFLTTWVAPPGWSFPLGLKLAPRVELCPLGGLFNPLFTPLLRRRKGQTEGLHPWGITSSLGDKVNPWEPTSLLGVKFRPQG